MICKTCDGTGDGFLFGKKGCPICRGTGSIYDEDEAEDEDEDEAEYWRRTCCTARRSFTGAQV